MSLPEKYTVDMEKMDSDSFYSELSIVFPDFVDFDIYIRSSA